jgi:hypothetical protein
LSRLLQSLDADGQPQGVRDSARQMLGTLDRLDARRAGPPPAGAAPPAASVGTPTALPASSDAPRADTPTPPAEHVPALHRTESPAPPGGNPGNLPSADRPGTPIFRDVGPGEKRVEGVLTAIECRQGAIVFHVDGQSPVARLSAPSFDDVDFITYRSDLTGTVPCGPVKEPMRVYVTVRPSATDGELLVIAVEFLPQAAAESR